MPRLDEIPVAHTPAGGYGEEFPPPVLAGCTAPLAGGAPDLRGLWEVVAVEVDGAPVDAHPAFGHGDDMLWAYLGFTARLRRIGGTDARPPAR